MLALPKSPKALFLSIVAVLAAAFVVAGCGGGSGGGGGEPAGLMPKTAPVYVEVDLAPEGKSAEAINELAGTVMGIENVGEFITEKLEEAAISDGEKLNFEKEIEPWLGEKAGIYLSSYDGQDFHGVGFAIETTDSGEAEEFVNKEAEDSKSGEKDTAAEFEGHKYWVEPEDETAVGMIGDYVAFGQGKKSFEEMVEAFEGEGLNESPKFKEAMENTPDEGVGTVYVDIGGTIEQAGSSIPPETQTFFELIQIEPKKATAVATVIPRSEQLEIDVSSNLGKSTPDTGSATAALEALPSTAVLGFAASEFGQSFAEGLERFSENGVPGQLAPGELGAAFEAMGINVKSLGKSFGDLSGFLEGTSQSDLGGAIMVETKSATEAANLVGNIGLIMRASKTPGVTVLKGGEIKGFSIRVPSLGTKPLIVGAAGEKIVIAFGPQAAAQALHSQAQTLGSTPGFEAAKAALGSTPMTAFVDGGPMLALVEGLMSPEDQAKLGEAKPYLEKIDYLGVGSESEGGTQTGKLIIGLTK
jgi:hypothetical protein